MKVSNGKCIRTLSHRSLRANRTRNIVAVLAIALTLSLIHIWVHRRGRRYHRRYLLRLCSGPSL